MEELTQLLDYLATNPDMKLTFFTRNMLLGIHNDASFMRFTKAKIRYAGYLYLGNAVKTKDRCQTPNGPIHIACKGFKYEVGSSSEAELGVLYHNGQHGSYIWMILEELGYPQPPTPMMTDNQAAKLIANDIGKQKRYRAINMRFYWIKDRVKMGQFKIFWRPGEENYGDYWTKHHLPDHHREIRPRALNSKKISYAKQSQGHTRGCVDPIRMSVRRTYAQTLIGHSCPFA